MPTYVMLSNLTDEGSKTIKHNPERIKEVNAELETLGVKVVAQYATLGPYDFVNIVEAADNLAVARVSAELASRGTIRLTTLPAIDIDSLIAALK
ncbi:MAG: GYD domain-containing protein [Anaerolineae bacterium]|nr:GYD domain-containing protein [Anaerolineae bacterium]